MHALQAVLVQIRLMAYDKAPHDVICDALDVAEILPTLVETPSAFREQLEALVVLDRRFAIALQRFDGTLP